MIATVSPLRSFCWNDERSLPANIFCPDTIADALKTTDDC